MLEIKDTDVVFPRYFGHLFESVSLSTSAVYIGRCDNLSRFLNVRHTKLQNRTQQGKCDRHTTISPAATALNHCGRKKEDMRRRL